MERAGWGEVTEKTNKERENQNEPVVLGWNGSIRVSSCSYRCKYMYIYIFIHMNKDKERCSCKCF